MAVEQSNGKTAVAGDPWLRAFGRHDIPEQALQRFSPSLPSAYRRNAIRAVVLA
jgi:hypothetical protein